ncbi:MAG: hypothetical protein IJH47_10560 [Oscillospiraceae bacterium]|nr:hypothetical protein [Oscillospiraceae bacterium]
MEQARKKRTLLNISQKTFVQVTLLLVVLLVVSVALTYIVPRGEFAPGPDGQPDYFSYARRDDLPGIPLWQGALAPVLVFFSSDGLTLLMLSLFLFVISAAFQVMDDAGGVRSLVGAVAERFRHRRRLLLVLISFLFYCFGAFLGLFEEMLSMLPIIASLCVMLGYDSFTGFLCCILSCGFGFASAITNPFTVLLASEIIGANPMEHIWFRLVIFAAMFALLTGYISLHLRRLKRDPSASPTFRRDQELRAAEQSADPETGENAGADRRVRRIYGAFLLAALALIVISSVLPAVRGYAVPILTAWFLVFGIAAGAAATGDLRAVIRSFLRGLGAAVPTIVFIALAASIKFVFDRGGILPTIVNQINTAVSGHSLFLVAVIIYLIVLLLEFFISSSTAKAILVMGILSVASVGLTRQMLVLIYTFADGYTNVLFPTSPVLLISLSMLEIDYFSWLRKSWPLFLANLALVLGFLFLGIAAGY